MAGLADAIAAAVAAQTRGPKCAAADILSALDEADRVSLVAALERPTRDVPTSALVTALAERKFKITAGTLNRHRGGHCACHR